MEYKELTEIDLKEQYPNNTSIKLETMNASEKENYLKKYNYYRKWYTEYIINKLSLKEYDKRIEESQLAFMPVGEKEMDMYQYVSSDELKFFYLRNNIYIEKLTKEEDSFLQAKVDHGDDVMDEAVQDFVGNTYQKVIFEDVGKDKKEYLMLFGPDSRNYMTTNNALVVGMRYDPFEKNGLNDEEWYKRYKEQNFIFLPKLLEEMMKKYEKEFLKQPITIFTYNEFSVKKR